MHTTTIHTQTLKTGLLALALTVLLCAASLMHMPRAVAAGRQDFTLRNQLGTTLYNVYVSRHDDSGWGSDVLADNEVILDGDSERITFPEDETARYWDLKVVDRDGNSHVWTNLRLTAISTITLHMVNGTATATTE